MVRCNARFASACAYLQRRYTGTVLDLRFESDEAKNRANGRKYGVSFEEAQTVFYDDYAILLEDDDPEEPEERFVLLGMSAGMRTLVVCHCFREDDEIIRIISARRADRYERRDYETRWKR
jgi:uncharacterized DUF497 family protein